MQPPEEFLLPAQRGTAQGIRPRSARPRRKIDERQSAQFRPLGHYCFAVVGTVHALPEPWSARVLAGHLVLPALHQIRSNPGPRRDKRKVSLPAEPPWDNVPWFVSLLVSWLPFIALIGVWIFLSRQMQGGAGKAMGFGKSRAKMLTEAHGRVTFEDVAGVDEAKQDLQEIVEFLRDPGKYQRLGGRIPRGVLLVGPPGTGKTLIARAVAGEANVPFFTISGSDFVEMFVGVGASRVRDMFEQAKK